MRFERVFTATELKILNHDLLDIHQWIDGMIDGKINNCKKRAANQYRELLKKEGATMVPVDDAVAAAELFARPDYKNRIERDAAEKK